MGCMGDFVPKRIGGAAVGRCDHFRLVAAAPGAMFAGGRFRGCRSERVGMAGGLGKVGGQLCSAERLGLDWLYSGSTLQYSTFRGLVQGRAGADCGTAVAGGQWPVVSGRWSVVRNGRDWCAQVGLASDGRCAQTAASSPRRVGDGLESRRYGGITSRSLTH